MAAAAAAAVVLSSSGFVGVGDACAKPPPPSPDTFLYDTGRLLAQDRRDRLDAQLADLYGRTGWNVRMITSYGPGTRPDDQDIRAAWGPLGKRSIVIEYDATAPSLINVPYLGDDVLQHLRRPWWFEFRARFGNMFYVREQGEQAALLASSQALLTCLDRPVGCRVVPGLPEEQQQLTFGASVAGGLVAGFVSRLEPQGFVQRKWVWLLLFSPLWASLFVNFGLGPVLSRTDDVLPLALNVAGFAAAAGAPYAAQLLRPPPLKDSQ